MMIDDPVRIRLAQLADQRAVSLAALSGILGRNASYLQQFLKKGSPRKLEEDDRRTLARFFGVAEAELGGRVEEKSFNLPVSRRSGNRDHYSVPRLAIGASAGSGALTDGEAAHGTLSFSRGFVKEQGLDPDLVSVIRVEGDSMEPLLRDGDEILVDRRPVRLADGIHVIRIDDTLMVKRLALMPGAELAIISENAAYPRLIRTLNDVQVIGRVVWKGGRISA